MAKVPLTIGFPWFTESDYNTIKNASSGQRRLLLNFDEWLKRSQTGFDEFVRKCRNVRKVYVDPDTFFAWCKVRSLNIDRDSLNNFINFMLRSMEVHE